MLSELQRDELSAWVSLLLKGVGQHLARHVIIRRGEHRIPEPLDAGTGAPLGRAVHRLLGRRQLDSTREDHLRNADFLRVRFPEIGSDGPQGSLGRIVGVPFEQPPKQRLAVEHGRGKVWRVELKHHNQRPRNSSIGRHLLVGAQALSNRVALVSIGFLLTFEQLRQLGRQRLDSPAACSRVTSQGQPGSMEVDVLASNWSGEVRERGFSQQLERLGDG
jgi:hypothetical protein